MTIFGLVACRPVAAALLIAGVLVTGAASKASGDEAVKKPAPAEELAPLTTDRPDFTESTETMGPGVAQLETGIQRTSHALRDGNTKTIGGPLSLLRIGLTKRLELRLGNDGMQAEFHHLSEGMEHHSGMADFSVGTKLKVLTESTRVPAFSVITGVSLPIGNTYFSSGGHDPFVKLCWSKSLPRGFDAGVNADFRWNTGGSAMPVERGFSLTAGHDLIGGFRGFWEVYRLSPVPDDERAHYVADTGISRLIGRNMQVDVAVGHTIMAKTPSWLVGVGFTVRCPVGAWLRHR